MQAGDQNGGGLGPRLGYAYMLPGICVRYLVYFLMISVLYQSLLHAATIIIVYILQYKVVN